MKKGFTLIELLLVIGILAILGTVVVFVIQPAEKLREARDAQRISDLRSVREAMNLYLAGNSSSQTTLNAADPPRCQAGNNEFPVWRASISALGIEKDPFFNPPTSGGGGLLPSVTLPTPSANDGSGWVPVNFLEVSIGRPLSKLPLDPRNEIPSGGSVFSSLAGPFTVTNGGTFVVDAAFFYAYMCQGLAYEIDANMESVKYSTGGTKDVESKDGGAKGRVFDCVDPVSSSVACSAGTVIISAPAAPSNFLSDRIYEVGSKAGLDL